MPIARRSGRHESTTPRAAAFALGVLALTVGGAARAADQPLSDVVAEAHRLYQRRQADEAADLLTGAVATLKLPHDLRDAYLILSACALLRDEPARAEDLAVEALSYHPDYHPDPLLFAPDVQAFIRSVAFRRRADIERLARSRAGKRPGTDAASADQSTSSGASTRHRNDPASASRQARLRPTPWPVAILPFGIGQLANGERTKGWLLLAAESTLVATSVAAFVAALGLRDADGRYAQGDFDTAKVLNAVYLSAAYTALATMIYGAIDGLINRHAASADP